MGEKENNKLSPHKSKRERDERWRTNDQERIHNKLTPEAHVREKERKKKTDRHAYRQ